VFLIAPEDERMTVQRQGMSEREYAAHAGVSRGAVQKARASGRLVLHADGSIDAAASDARRRQATDPSMQRGRHNPSLRPVPDTAVGAVAETLREQGLPAPQAAGRRQSRPIRSPSASTSPACTLRSAGCRGSGSQGSGRRAKRWSRRSGSAAKSWPA